MPSISHVPHAITWDYFTKRLAGRFIDSPITVKELIMTDINDLVQEFWTSSSYGAVWASSFAMRRLLEIFANIFDFLVSFDSIIFSIFANCCRIS